MSHLAAPFVIALGLCYRQPHFGSQLESVQHPLRAWLLALSALDFRGRNAYRNREGLEGALRPVVVVVPADAVDVQRDRGPLREALKTVREHLCAQVAYLLSLEAQINHTERSV